MRSRNRLLGSGIAYGEDVPVVPVVAFPSWMVKEGNSPKLAKSAEEVTQLLSSGWVAVDNLDAFLKGEEERLSAYTPTSKSKKKE
jgi:hypothetical protein